MSQLKKNLGYQTVSQVLETCLPLVTAPYLSRVLGSTQQGVYSYTNSIVLYFTLFSMLGTINYGTRSIAAVKENIVQRSKTFWGIYSLQAIMSLLAIAAYLFYFSAFCRKDRLIAFLQMFQIVNCLLDINWLYFGLEQFKVTVSRSIFVKAISFVLLFLLVRSRNDLWIYTLLIVGSNVVSQILLWIRLPKVIRFTKVRFRDIREHIYPNLMLFIPFLAMSVYHIMDKTMLGMMSSDDQSGFYYNSDKLINIPLGIIYGIGTVMLPRITSLMANGNDDEAHKLFRTSIEGVALASSAMAFGISAIAKEFVPFFFGDDFVASIAITIVLAPVLVAKGVSNTVRAEYLIPYHMESKFIASVIAGAVTNLIANSILIPLYGGLGAAIGTLIAELVSCLWQVIAVWKKADISRAASNSAIYILIGFVMYGIVRLCAERLSMNITLQLFIEVSIGAAAYFSLCFLFWKLTKNNILINLFGNIRK